MVAVRGAPGRARAEKGRSVSHLASHQNEGEAAVMGRLLARLVCRWKGHIWVRFFQRGRVALRCTRCLAETPGWPAEAASTVGLHARRVH